MTSVFFDPDAKAEFLAAVQYYEDCQDGLGHNFRLAVESSIKKIIEAPFHSCIDYYVLLSDVFSCHNFHMRSCIQ